jgi:hypothetical protein
LLDIVNLGWANKAKIITILHQIPEAHEHAFVSKTLFIYTSTVVETVKLNFHLDLYATLDCYLNSGPGLALQVLCESSFTEILDQYYAAVGLTRGWSLYIIVPGHL